MVEFLLAMSLFWIGYERLWETISAAQYWRAGPKSSEVTEKAIIKTLEDSSQRIIGIYADMQKDGIDQNELSKLQVMARTELAAAEALTGTVRGVTYASRAPSPAKKVLIYLFALLVGLFVSIIGGLTLGDALIQDGWALSESILLVDQWIITPLLFAGGPDVIHQVFALVEESKEKAKRT